MTQHQYTSRPLLTEDVLATIISMVPRGTLLNFRLVNRSLSALATKRAFRHICLFAAEEGTRFVDIARSEALRSCVREITCDTKLAEDDYTYHSNGDFAFPWRFMAALPFVRYFERLEVLNLNFNEYCGPENNDEDLLDGILIEESPDIRFRILDTIFHCLEGTWSAENQREVDEELDLSDDRDILDIEDDPEVAFYKDDHQGFAAPIHDPPSSVCLTISNLGDFDDPRLTKSDTFRRVIASQISELKILFTVQTDEASPESTIYRPEKYDLMKNLPHTWLMPSLAMNLTVLSLYCRDYWGWIPRMDFRCVNPGSGPGSGFPNLRVLALGNYVFTHEWQVDWIASLGLQNGRGGLEELYLDDSPILYKARMVQPMNSGESEVTNLVTGEVISISDELYPLPEVVMGGTYNPEIIYFPLRWDYVLGRWRDLMKGLRVFRMGHGAWWQHYCFDRAIESDEWIQSSDRRDFISYDCPAFRWYNCPVVDQESDEYYEGCELFREGEGLQLAREYQCQYIEYDIGTGPTQWQELRDRYQYTYYPYYPKLNPELDPTGTLMKDEDEALGSLLEITDQRRKMNLTI
ncbi:hypothetical protein M441DRAFT_62130 [Trichoderma asperellum CBS 433.97]|uniref:F-box domain-containing protein n=1 Tax=Trichoderma asperellum (strain ATCC 204424 / CBS 433.97 / NBRC 101777) TaxID=1042311 RepID=A0A2T3YU48_TRIA4|nr:hypothetical protein M441DRAFT_62130 [Trichoderma asperellum CBS 433.97]PTB36101.1 hypothetical protein M441DRAFT_62130 [Trichoderma asperellum CBS 433.97]